MRAVLVLALAFALTGCGGAREHGTATLWVTRDRGAHVLYSGKVPAGLTALQALDRRTDVKTRYGGRFVQAIDGVEGDVGKQRDWFYFVNGVEASKGAADVRLRSGDVEWWDYRSWKGGAMSVPVVVGAFPEPFLHGFDWVKPGVVVNALAPADFPLARRLAGQVHGRATSGALTRLDHAHASLIQIVRVFPRATIARRSGHGVVLTLGTQLADRLSRDPGALRYRYEVRG